MDPIHGRSKVLMDPFHVQFSPQRVHFMSGSGYHHIVTQGPKVTNKYAAVEPWSNLSTIQKIFKGEYEILFILSGSHKLINLQQICLFDIEVAANSLLNVFEFAKYPATILSPTKTPQLSVILFLQHSSHFLSPVCLPTSIDSSQAAWQLFGSCFQDIFFCLNAP